VIDGALAGAASWYRADMRRPRPALLVALVALAGCGGDDQPPPIGPIGYQALHYDYAFDLDSRAAASAVTVEVTTAGDCLDLPMRAGGLTDLTLDGAPASGSLSGGVLHACGAGWEVGAQLELRAAVTVALETWSSGSEVSQVGYSVSDDLEGAPFSYLVSWVGGCDRFGPCDNAPDRFATYRFTVAHPDGTRVLCPGVITAGATETVCAFDYPGGPTYSTFGLAADPSWTATDLGDWGGVQATLYDTPSSGVGAKLDPVRHAGFLAWMVDHFGPYPYGDELRFATGPTHWSGFEHPGNILLYDRLGTGFSSYADPVGHVVDHEMAHMWAGDQTTLAGTYDFVWKEAMAEYLAFVYEDEAVSATEAEATAKAWKSFARSAAYWPVPLDQPPLLDYYGDVYGPGPLILFRQLEALYSRADVLDALASLLGSPHAIGVTDVQAALEDATGADLDGYFTAWVYGEGAPTWPTFRVDVADAGSGDVSVTVTQTAPTAPHGCAFAVALTGDLGESSEVWLDLGVAGMASKTVTVTPGFTVTGHTFDPHADCLATEDISAAAPPPPRRNPWVTR